MDFEREIEIAACGLLLPAPQARCLAQAALKRAIALKGGFRGDLINIAIARPIVNEVLQRSLRDIATELSARLHATGIDDRVVERVERDLSEMLARALAVTEQYFGRES